MSKAKSKQVSPKNQLVTIDKSQNYKWAILAVFVLVIGLPLFYYFFPRQPVSKSTSFTTPIPSNTLDNYKATSQPKDIPPEFQRAHICKPLAAQQIPPVSDDDREVFKHSQGWHVVAQEDQGVAIRPITQHTPQTPDVVLLHEHVIRSFPHDATCFTQGYAFYGGELFESCGLYSRSSLRHINYETGKPTKSREMPREHLEPERHLSTEGWRVVIDPLYSQFMISDGSYSLFRYDMNTMKLLRPIIIYSMVSLFLRPRVIIQAYWRRLIEITNVPFFDFSTYNI